MTTIGSDLDGVICYSILDRRDFRPFRMHQFYALCTPGVLSRVHVEFIITGRKQCYRRTTEKWLLENGVQYRELVMFPTGVQKSNDTLKRYKSHWINTLEIEVFYDDDKKIVEYLEKTCPSTKIILCQM